MEINRVTDLSYLISICNDDRTFKIEMLETFINNTPQIIQEMNAISSMNNWKQIGDLAHKIKPSFTFMGIESAKDIILKIEHNGRSGLDTDIIPSQLNELNKIFNLALIELTEELEKTKLDN